MVCCLISLHTFHNEIFGKFSEKFSMIFLLLNLIFQSLHENDTKSIKFYINFSTRSLRLNSRLVSMTMKIQLRWSMKISVLYERHRSSSSKEKSSSRVPIGRKIFFTVICISHREWVNEGLIICVHNEWSKGWRAPARRVIIPSVACVWLLLSIHTCVSTFETETSSRYP